jgi:importin subunit beta-1
MQVLLNVLTTVGAKSSVPDVIFATVGAVASALDEDFAKYMESFSPFLYNALEHQEEAGLCSMAIGLVSDIARALNDKVQPYCDTFMNLLLSILRVCPTLTANLRRDCLLIFYNKTSTNQLKPAILETFGDIAQAIGTPHFDNYLPVVGQVLQQASSVTTSSDLPYDMVDYIVSLREGIMDAWGGILLSYKGSAQSKSILSSAQFYSANKYSVTLIQPFVESIFQLLHIISQEGNRSEGLMRSAMGVIG